MKRQMFFIGVTLLAVSVFSFVDATEHAEDREKVFKLGILGPFSGPNARIGEQFQGAVIMAFDDIHWQIGEYKIEAVWIDSQSDPAEAIQAYQQAVAQDGIQTGILNWHSSVALACMDVAAEYQIPHVFALGATGAINEKFRSNPEKYGYWMVKAWPTPEKLSIFYVQALEEAIKNGIWVPAKKTVGIYGEDSVWGRSFGNGIKKQFEHAGWGIVTEEYFTSRTQTDLSPLFAKLEQFAPAVIAGTSTESPAALPAFIKQADEAGLQSLIIADGLGWSGKWYGLTGKSSDYVIDQIPRWTTEKGKLFAAEFEKRWGLVSSPSSGGLAYDGVNFFIAVANAAIEQYGELSSASIYRFVKENFWTGDWSYTDGVVMHAYAATPETVPDPVVGKGYYLFPVIQYFDGVGKIIFPSEWAEQNLTPKP